MVKVIIFDLDDTLISERRYIESGYYHIAEILGKRLNKKKEEIYNDLTELLYESSKNVFNRLFDKYGISYTEEMIRELVNEYRNHLPIIDFYDDVIPTLTALKQKGIKLGIISDGYSNTQRNKLKVLNATQYFDKIILTDELGRENWKPSPTAFEMMKNYFNVAYMEMIYVGDNPQKDFYIKKVHPIKTIRIIRKNSIYLNEQYLDGIMEDVRVCDLITLVENKL